MLNDSIKDAILNDLFKSINTNNKFRHRCLLTGISEESLVKIEDVKLLRKKLENKTGDENK
jgi:hypothetical protein